MLLLEKKLSVEQDPNKRVDLGGTLFSSVTKELIATTYTDAKTEIYWKDKKFAKDYKWLKEKTLWQRNQNRRGNKRRKHFQN